MLSLQNINTISEEKGKKRKEKNEIICVFNIKTS